MSGWGFKRRTKYPVGEEALNFVLYLRGDISQESALHRYNNHRAKNYKADMDNRMLQALLKTIFIKFAFKSRLELH